MRLKTFLLALLLAVGPADLPGRPAGEDPPRPVTAVRTVTDIYHGVAVADPYRWLEDTGDPEVLNWARAQGEAARSFLDGRAGRRALEERLAALDRNSSGVHSLQAASGLYFFLKSGPNDETDGLYVRVGRQGKERLLYDPAQESRPGQRLALNYYRASFDGRFVALGVSPNGSENAVLRIMDVRSASFIDGEVDRVVFGQAVNWSGDSAFVFYTRLRLPSPGEPPVRRYARSGAYAHKIGTSPAEDVLVLGEDRSASVTLDDFDVPLLLSHPGSDRLFAVVARGVGRDLAIWACPSSPGIRAADPGWEEICGFGASLSRPVLRGDRLYGLSSKDAPRFRVVAADIADPRREWETVLPASPLVLTSLGAAKDGLYIQALDGGINRLLRMPYGGMKFQVLRLPFPGTIRELVADPQDRGVVVRLASWTRPSIWLAYDPGSGHFRDLGWDPAQGFDFSNYESLEVEVRGHDGTTIPLSIVMPRGLRQDASHPAILEAYGAYGAAVTPYFDPALAAWLERGGIWAFAHVRGGGEFGEEWHQAGMKGNKANSVKDYIACAEYLVARKFTSPGRLAAVGASAGGVVIGGALAKRPALFGAAVIDAGLFDCLRREQEANSQLGAAEFGTVRTEEGFRALLAMSPYHMIKDGSPFPAVLLLTALNDPRVSPWQSFKFAARLQAATAGNKPVVLRLEPKGGHGVGEARSSELAKRVDVYAFLLDALTPAPGRDRSQSVYCYMPIPI